ncbi:MAG: CRISPR-associated endonuclease Cas2 [Patescibacteria group bacterium]
MKLLDRKDKSPDKELSIPSDDRIASLSAILTKNIQQEEVHRRYASIKRILTGIGVVGVIGLAFVAPTAMMLAKPFLDEKKQRERDEWKHYNPSYLRRSIHRLQKQKLVEILYKDEIEIVILTQFGKRRILKYALNELSIEAPKQWDGRWRMIIYDVDEKKKKLRDTFRRALISLGFLKLQESVWVYPYPCEEQITFLREYYGVGSEVIYVVATKLEDDTPYREYFDIT